MMVKNNEKFKVTPEANKLLFIQEKKKSFLETKVYKCFAFISKTQMSIKCYAFSFIIVTLFLILLLCIVLSGWY